jgi:anaerobic C4-dicarboxylate transporter DcuA
MHKSLFIHTFSDLLVSAPFLFAVVLFILSALLFSQGATVTALVPLGITLGIAPGMLVAMFPAVNGTTLIPAATSVVACVAFDRAGTTKVGKYVLNHSIALPTVVTATTATALGYVFSRIVF